jgi:hypothetical protein
MTHCGWRGVEKQFTMVNRNDWKFKAVASPPQPVSNKSKQLPPEPKMGLRPTIRMFASFQDEKNFHVRVLLDTGGDTPMMSKQCTDSHGVPLVTWTESKIVKNFNGERVEEEGWQYTFPSTLRYESYYTNDTSEIGPMVDVSDIILPYWWIIKHVALSGVTEENNKPQYM